MIDLRPQDVSYITRRLDARWAARSPFVLAALVLGATLIGTVAIQGRLVGAQDAAATRALFASSPNFTTIKLPLLMDPVGLAVIVVALMTPIFCGEQIQSISMFVRMNVDNGMERVYERSVRAMLDREAQLANRAFTYIGKWYVSIICGFTAWFLSRYTFGQFADGILLDWVPKQGALPADVCRNVARTSEDCQAQWGAAVLDGWWASPSDAVASHRILFFLTVYMWYWAIKQWMLGAVFYVYARRTYARGFGLVDSLVNVDGYWGLRPLRRFMQWTYLSTLSHVSLFVLVYWIWLAGQPGRLQLGTWFALMGVVVVVLPSSIAYKGVVRTRAQRVKNDELVDPAAISGMWSRSVLPFRVRSAITAVVIYLIVPLTVAIVSRG